MTDTIAIALAALAGDPTRLEALLKQRADAFFKCDLSGLVYTKLLGYVTPLSCAAHSGSKACVELLLNADKGLKPQFHYKHYQDTVAQLGISTWWTALGDKTFIMSPLHYAFGIDTTFPFFLERAIHEHDQTQRVGHRFYEQPTRVFRLMFSLAQFAIWLTSKNLPAPNYEAMYAQGQAMIAQLNATTKGADTARNNFIHTLVSTSTQTFVSTWSASKIGRHPNDRYYIALGTAKDILIKHMDDAILLLMRMGLLPIPSLPNANIVNLIRRAEIQGLKHTAQYLKNSFPEEAKIASTALPAAFAEHRSLFEGTPYSDAAVARLYDYPKTSLSPTTATPKPTASSSTTPVKTSSSVSVEERTETVALQQKVAMLEGELSRMQTQMTQMFNTLAALSQNPTSTYSSSMGPSSSVVPTAHQSPAPLHYGLPYMMPQMSHGYPIPSHYSPPGGLYPGPSAFPATPASWPPPESPTFTSSANNFPIASAPAADIPTLPGSEPSPTLSEKQPGLWHTVPTSLPVSASSQPGLDSHANPKAEAATTLTN